MPEITEFLEEIVQEPHNQKRLLSLCQPKQNERGVHMASREQALTQCFRDRRFRYVAQNMVVPFTSWLSSTKQSFSEGAFWTWATRH